MSRKKTLLQNNGEGQGSDPNLPTQNIPDGAGRM